MIDYSVVGQRIAARRKQLGLKQYQVCEMIDVNYKYLSNLETGRSAPSLELIMSLCNALDTTPDYLLTGTDKNQITVGDITDKLKKLNNSNRILVNGIIDLMLDQQ